MDKKVSTPANNIYIFDRDTSEQISRLSCMPTVITENRVPCIQGAWSRHLAAAFADDAGDGSDGTRMRSVPISNIGSVKKIDSGIEGVMKGTASGLASDDDVISLPMLLGNRFFLETSRERADVPGDIAHIVEGHRKKMLWMRRDAYERLWDEREHTEEIIAFAPGRFATDEENVNAITYLLQFFRKR